MSEPTPIAEKVPEPFPRPIDPNAPQVTIPTLESPLAVMAFYREHGKALTWPQVDELMQRHDALAAREERGPRPPGRPQVSPEQVLTAAWHDACAATQDESERRGKVAEAACNLLGASGGMQIHRVVKLYDSLGMRNVNRAVIELAKEPLEPGQRFKFLEHRATLQRGVKAV